MGKIVISLQVSDNDVPAVAKAINDFFGQSYKPLSLSSLRASPHFRLAKYDESKWSSECMERLQSFGQTVVPVHMQQSEVAIERSRTLQWIFNGLNDAEKIREYVQEQVVRGVNTSAGTIPFEFPLPVLYVSSGNIPSTFFQKPQPNLAVVCDAIGIYYVDRESGCTCLEKVCLGTPKQTATV